VKLRLKTKKTQDQEWVLELRFAHLYWLKAYYWWLLAKYIPLAEKHRRLSIPVYAVARLAYNLALGLLLVVDAVRVLTYSRYRTRR
jgi:hypothetical protein